MARQSKRSFAAEWIGGIRTLDIELRDGPDRPQVALFLDASSGKVLAAELGAKMSLVDALAVARRRSRRSPARIHVESERDAAGLRRALPTVDIVIRPLPEIDEVVADFRRHLNDTAPATPYAADDVTDEILARFFAAAAALYRKKPWSVIDDAQVLELSVPALSIEGACVSVIGGLGKNFGLLIFPSIGAFESFADSGSREVSLVALELERDDEWPRPWRERVAAAKWPIAAKDAFPLTSIIERGQARPGDRRAFRLATAAAEATVAFLDAHADLFSSTWDGRQRSADHTGPSGLTTRIVAPPAAFIEAAPNTREAPGRAPEPPSATSRNAPCPCGSGKKYKRCCLLVEHDSPAAIAWSHHAIERRLVPLLYSFLEATHRYEDFERSMRGFAFASGPREAFDQLIRPYALYASMTDGQPSHARRFLDAYAKKLAPNERAYLEAQVAARLSLWEVLGADRGESLRLRDRLSKVERTVYDKSASKTIPVREILLARIVELDGVCTMSAVHGRTLSPAEGARLEATIPKYLKRVGATLPDVVATASFERFLIEGWLALVDAVDNRPPPTLQTTDGEPFLFTTDHFVFSASDRALLVERLTALPDVSTGADEHSFAFFKRGNARLAHLDNTILGHVTIDADRLTLDTNSVARADRLKARLLALDVPTLRHRIREHSDPLSAPTRAEAHSREHVVDELPPEALAALKQMTDEHYRSWPDVPLPALGGKTPREAARSRSKKLRAEVDLLLRAMENADERQPNPHYRYDFSRLRRELRLDD